MIYSDTKGTPIVDLKIGDIVYFYDFFGLAKGVVIEDNYIRSGGNLWIAEKVDGVWEVISGFNEKAAEMLGELMAQQEGSR